MQSGYAKVVQVLTEFGGSSPDATRADGVTALMLAARNGQLSCIEQLLAGSAHAFKAVPEPPDSSVVLAEPVGYTALHGASRMGYVETVRVLVNHGAVVDAPMKDGKTSLILAVINQQFSVVTLLLNLGAKVDIKDGAGYTALLRAAESGAGDVTRALVAAKADVHTTLDNQMSALHLASRAGHAGVVAALLPHHNTTSPAHAQQKPTPLHLACERGHVSVALLLLAWTSTPMPETHRAGPHVTSQPRTSTPTS